MRTFIAAMVAALLLMALVSAPAQAQKQTTIPVTVVNAKAYANSQVDISGTFYVGQYERLGLTFHALDSAVVTIAVDTRPWGGATWTALDSLTITSAVDAGVYQEYIIRNQVLDKASAGVMCATRFRFSFSGSANGVTSATYTATLNGR